MKPITLKTADNIVFLKCNIHKQDLYEFLRLGDIWWQMYMHGPGPIHRSLQPNH